MPSFAKIASPCGPCAPVLPLSPVAFTPVEVHVLPPSVEISHKFVSVLIRICGAIASAPLSPCAFTPVSVVPIHQLPLSPM